MPRNYRLSNAWRQLVAIPWACGQKQSSRLLRYHQETHGPLNDSEKGRSWPEGRKWWALGTETKKAECRGRRACLIYISRRVQNRHCLDIRECKDLQS